jgi:hypothetical protein
MYIEVLADEPWQDDPAQGLVRIETTRTNNFVGMGVHFGWVEAADEAAVSITRCVDRDGTHGDYMLHLNPAHIVSWRYADLIEVPR